MMGAKRLGGSAAVALALSALLACGDNGPASRLDPDASAPPDGVIPEPPGPPSPPSPPPPTPPVPPGPPELAAVCGGAAPVTLADWEQCYLRRSCEVQVHCGGAAYFSTVEECLALSDAVAGGKLSFAVGERARALAAGRATLDVAQYTTCLLGLSAERCGTGWRDPACELLFAGTVADQQACYADIECASPGATCAPSDCGDSCCLGTCAPRRRLGETCVELFECEPGLVCGGGGRCVSGDLGTSCASGRDCDWDAWCDVAAHQCKADVDEGQPCQSFLQCAGETFCVGLFRPVQPPRCLRVTHEGDPCDGDCLGNLYCKLPASGLGVCAALPKDGESCNALLPCVGANEICQSGTCVARPGVGEPCASGVCQRGLFCAAGSTGPARCRAPLANGIRGCHSPEECESHICSGDLAQPGVCQPYQAECP